MLLSLFSFEGGESLFVSKKVNIHLKASFWKDHFLRLNASFLFIVVGVAAIDEAILSLNTSIIRRVCLPCLLCMYVPLYNYILWSTAIVVN